MTPEKMSGVYTYGTSTLRLCPNKITIDCYRFTEILLLRK